ncbi:hypothetical protein [Burkholderia cenocepacia]|uniref:hypothetical protein n=1 Tax=Burkholderia cenocepacia TaxID=95486 RepID=UPI0007618BA9|nr:hypothetical protein [Burkholderia cenocepacia]KWU26366.1 hypothetical protein AS149_25595 [Burkholderia cenocepacia]
MTQNHEQPSYSEVVETICNLRTAEEVRDDEWTDEVKAAIQTAATTYGKSYTQVAQDVDVESPEVLKRNFEEHQEMLDALDIGPYPGGEH